MANLSLSNCVSASVQLQSSCKMALLRFRSPHLLRAKDFPKYFRESNGLWSVHVDGAHHTRWCISCATHLAAGQSDDSEKVNLNRVTDKVKVNLSRVTDKMKRLWDRTPQPVKDFPWNRALDNFIQLIIDLIVSVVKYLAVPLFAVTSLSEMSYCAHEKKLFLVPFPLLVGIAVAGVLKETALEMSPRLKDAEVPWHLIAIAIFFTLIKLPGPYYPYWGRIIIPHIANGALLRTLWFAFTWYRRAGKAPGTSSPNSL